MPTGRPTKYRAEHAKQAAKLCKLGATDADLADFFDVNESTIYAWKAQHAPFSKAIKRSKEELDRQVKQSLFRRAMGFSHKAEKVFLPAGAKEPTVVEYEEHYAADTTACIFWLCNRQPDKWKRNVTQSDDDTPVPSRVVVEIEDGRKDA